MVTGIISLAAVPAALALVGHAPATLPQTTPAATVASPSSSARVNMSYALYGARGGKLTTGFDGYKHTRGRHEGIDFARRTGSNVRALVTGQIIGLVPGRNGGKRLSTISIYNKSLNKTVIYLHTAPLSSLRKYQMIRRGQIIARESWRGVTESKNAHTHVEMRLGKRERAARSRNDPRLDNPNPGRFWNSQGYNVR